MSGTGTSSRTRALPYSCMRAAFMSSFLSKWWVFKIQVSLGGWLRSVFGDDHHLLVDKFLDAVLWGYPLLLPIVSLGSLATRTRCIGRLYLVTKCSDSRLCNRNVLFNGAGTCSDRTYDGSVQNDGYSAAEDDDLSRVAFLNAEERLSRLRESREVRGLFIEDSGCSSLVDGEVDAADERAVLAHEGH